MNSKNLLKTVNVDKGTRLQYLKKDRSIGVDKIRTEALDLFIEQVLKDVITLRYKYNRKT